MVPMLPLRKEDTTCIPGYELSPPCLYGPICDGVI